MLDLSVISPGSVLLLHSSLSRTLRVHRTTPEAVLLAVLERLGDHGTLLLPLFNFDFTSGTAFDVRSTPSQMGALTEIGWTWPGAVRTGHPVYSFAAIGAESERFAGVDNRTAFGADSPFAILRDLGGDIGVLDLSENRSMTFNHHVEEMVGVDYRYQKTFTGPYTDASGRTEQRSYRILVRDLEQRVLNSGDRMGERIWELGLYRGDRPGVGTGLRVVGADEEYRAVSDVIRAGRARDYLYEIED